jgi:nucleotide-binding universal stress UspA family protein
LFKELGMDTSQTRFDRILVPLDGSPLSERALPYVESIARSGTELILLRVMADADGMDDLRGPLAAAADEGRRRGRQVALRDLHRAAHNLRSAVSGACVQVVVTDGDPAEEILRAASDLGLGLIVMAGEGRGTTGRFGLGSVADRVVRSSPIPVLVVREGEARTAAAPVPVRRIVVPLDGSDRSAQALTAAEDLAKRFGVPILLLTVVDVATSGPPALSRDVAYSQDLYRELFADLQLDAQQTLDRAGAQLARHGLRVVRQLLAGPTAATIMDATCTGDVIVITSRGRGGARRWPIGSVAEKLIHAGPVPVVLVPAGPEPEFVAPVVVDALHWEPARGECKTGAGLDQSRFTPRSRWRSSQ